MKSPTRSSLAPSALVVGAIIAFIVGVSVPAVAASYPGSYKKVFGHSTSCAMGQASINDSTYKSGSRTSNFKGCSSSNATRNVPANYLGAQAINYNWMNGAVCGTSTAKWNTSSTWTQTQTAPVHAGSASGCPNPGSYIGRSFSYRKSDAGPTYLNSEIYSPVKNISISIWT